MSSQPSLTAALVPSPVIKQQHFLSKRETSPSRPGRQRRIFRDWDSRRMFTPPLASPSPESPGARHRFPAMDRRDDSGVLRER
jgi:hypothetical protein